MSEAFDKLPAPTDEELREVVQLMVENRLFGSWMVPEAQMISMIFMPLALGGLDGFEPGDDIVIWEDMHEAGPRSMNGYPLFMSCKVWRRSDMLRAVEIFDKAHKAAKEIMDEAFGGGA